MKKKNGAQKLHFALVGSRLASVEKDQSFRLPFVDIYIARGPIALCWSPLLVPLGASENTCFFSFISNSATTN